MKKHSKQQRKRQLLRVRWFAVSGEAAEEPAPVGKAEGPKDAVADNGSVWSSNSWWSSNNSGWQSRTPKSKTGQQWESSSWQSGNNDQQWRSSSWQSGHVWQKVSWPGKQWCVFCRQNMLQACGRQRTDIPAGGAGRAGKDS